MVYMSGSKMARHAASLTNQTTIFGIMGGIPSRTNRRVSSIRALQIHSTSSLAGMPTRPGPGLEYMRRLGILSVNPQASGGVGKRVLLYTTGQQQPVTH